MSDQVTTQSHSKKRREIPFALWLPARVFSNVFHPLFVPSACVILLFYFNELRFSYLNEKQKAITLIIVFCCTFLYPAISILIMKKLGLINQVNLRNRTDRFLPYMAGLTFSIWLSFMVIKPGNNPLLPSDKLLMHMIIGSTLSLVIAFICNLFLKVSMHMLGMGGFVGFVMFTAPYAENSMTGLFVLSWLIAGAVGTSRLILKAHQPIEVYSGFFIGLIGQFISFKILFFLGALS